MEKLEYVDVGTLFFPTGLKVQHVRLVSEVQRVSVRNISVKNAFLRF